MPEGGEIEISTGPTTVGEGGSRRLHCTSVGVSSAGKRGRAPVSRGASRLVASPLYDSADDDVLSVV